MPPMFHLHREMPFSIWGNRWHFNASVFMQLHTNGRDKMLNALFLTSINMKNKNWKKEDRILGTPMFSWEEAY